MNEYSRLTPNPVIFTEVNRQGVSISVFVPELCVILMGHIMLRSFVQTLLLPIMKFIKIQDTTRVVTQVTNVPEKVS
jgi:hypothetical protein